MLIRYYFFFFFFQAEDGIRDDLVTGVQTCALPLAGNTTLLADFDFRRPIVHTLFGVDRSPGITDYLLGRVPLHKAMRKVAGTNLYIMPAGEAVINPLELLNLREAKTMMDRLPPF